MCTLGLGANNASSLHDDEAFKLRWDMLQCYNAMGASPEITPISCRVDTRMRV